MYLYKYHIYIYLETNYMLQNNREFIDIYIVLLYTIRSINVVKKTTCYKYIHEH